MYLIDAGYWINTIKGEYYLSKTDKKHKQNRLYFYKHYITEVKCGDRKPLEKRGDSEKPNE